MGFLRSVKTNKEDPEKEWKELLESDYWKMPPKWTQDNSKKTRLYNKIKNIPWKIYEFLVVRISYEDYFASQLRSRYMDIEGNFRTTFNNEEYIRNTAKFQNSSFFIKELLILSKGILERQKLSKTDLLAASSLLDEAEERMIWILPPDVKKAKIRELDYEIDKFELKQKNTFENILKDYKNYEPNKVAVEPQKDESIFNADLEEIIRAINKRTLAKRIDTGLQIERLRSVRFWGFILLLIFILMFPMIGDIRIWTPSDTLVDNWGNITRNLSTDTVCENGNPISDLGCQSVRLFKLLLKKIPIETFSGWGVALSFCIIGGIGGFLSGLRQVRTSETNLELYEEAVLLFQIRPMFGAFAALITYVFMSWGALFSKEMGAIALTAFLSGFSERYFLQLLKINPESNDVEETEKPEK